MASEMAHSQKLKLPEFGAQDFTGVETPARDIKLPRFWPLEEIYSFQCWKLAYDKRGRSIEEMKAGNCNSVQLNRGVAWAVPPSSVAWTTLTKLEAGTSWEEGLGEF